MDGYYQAMRSRGFSRDTVDSIRRFKCPNCGFEFSITYARTFACRGCPEVMNNCPKVRCSKCDYEFYFRETPHITGKLREREVSHHISAIVEDYYKQQGWKKGR
ncbi:MAG: hypothetical protein KBH31_02415 [Methanomassiliicoccales archaeon]|nr:hypothetical protein [Methanomassiliicoccales archaeon]MCE5261633.1 hypothetical protein [Euryarchaeota archaeon]